jgi:hypothetical protein
MPRLPPSMRTVAVKSLFGFVKWNVLLENSRTVFAVVLPPRMRPASVTSPLITVTGNGEVVLEAAKTLVIPPTVERVMSFCIAAVPTAKFITVPLKVFASITGPVPNPVGELIRKAAFALPRTPPVNMFAPPRVSVLGAVGAKNRLPVPSMVPLKVLFTVLLPMTVSALVPGMPVSLRAIVDNEPPVRSVIVFWNEPVSRRA